MRTATLGIASPSLRPWTAGPLRLPPLEGLREGGISSFGRCSQLQQEVTGGSDVIVLVPEYRTGRMREVTTRFVLSIALLQPREGTGQASFPGTPPGLRRALRREGCAAAALVPSDLMQYWAELPRGVCRACRRGWGQREWPREFSHCQEPAVSLPALCSSCSCCSLLLLDSLPPGNRRSVRPSAVFCSPQNGPSLPG